MSSNGGEEFGFGGRIVFLDGGHFLFPRGHLIDKGSDEAVEGDGVWNGFNIREIFPVVIFMLNEFVILLSCERLPGLDLGLRRA